MSGRTVRSVTQSQSAAVRPAANPAAAGPATMTARVRLVAIGAVIASLTCGCSQSPAPSDSQTRAAQTSSSQPSGETRAAAPLSPVVLPDLTSVSDPVRQQITARDRELQAALGDGSRTPADRAALYGAVGHVLMAATFFDEAQLAYRHAEALQPSTPKWPYLAGHAAVRKGDRDTAVRAFERTLALEPSYSPALIWLGDMQLDLGRPQDARATFARAVAQNGESAAALFGAGRAALAAGAYTEAVQHFEHALRIDPRASAIRYPLAMAYRRAGASDKAEPLLQQRGNVAPALPDPLLQSADVVLDSAVSHEALGMQALRSQDWAGAITTFARGLEVAPNDPSLRYWLASAMIASGDEKGAERQFREVVRRHPDYAKAHFSLGAIAERRGQRAEAVKEYEAAVRYAPNMPDARLRLADTLRASNQLRAAVTQYDETIKLDPGLISAWTGAIQTLIALGDTAEARAWLQRAQRVHPSNNALTDLARRLRASGSTSSAAFR